MTPADRQAVIGCLDEMAAIFMRLDRHLRDLLQADPEADPDSTGVAAELAALNPYPNRRSR